MQNGAFSAEVGGLCFWKQDFGNLNSERDANLSTSGGWGELRESSRENLAHGVSSFKKRTVNQRDEEAISTAILRK